MAGLEHWLEQAARGLAGESAARVRSEIQQHYDSAREAAIGDGASPDDAEHAAVSALGNPKAANRGYRRVLLTVAEAKFLREGRLDTRAFIRFTFIGFLALTFLGLLDHAMGNYPIPALVWVNLARIVLVLVIGWVFPIAEWLLPVHTPSRSRVFRGAKWIVYTGAILLAFGPGGIIRDLLILSLFQVAPVELMRYSIRRKLPVAQWPRSLYL